MAQLAASLSIFLLALVLSISGVISRTFTIINRCEYTVWPGIVSNPGVPALCSTGFTLHMRESMTIATPNSWAGVFWGRTLCSQDSAGQFTCFTGDCGSGKIDCSGQGALPPATLAEFKLNASGGFDLFSVSLVDGYNLPVLIVPQGGNGAGCKYAGCVADLNDWCPSELQVRSPKGNECVACRSACNFFDLPQYCCRAANGTPDTCKPSTYSQIFKTACPRASTFAYDYKWSSFVCPSADYMIIFCPNSKTRLKFSTTPSSPCINSKTISQPMVIKVKTMVEIVAGVLTTIATIWGFCTCFYKYFPSEPTSSTNGNVEVEATSHQRQGHPASTAIQARGVIEP